MSEKIIDWDRPLISVEDGRPARLIASDAASTGDFNYVVLVTFNNVGDEQPHKVNKYGQTIQDLMPFVVKNAPRVHEEYEGKTETAFLSLGDSFDNLDAAKERHSYRWPILEVLLEDGKITGTKSHGMEIDDD